MLYNRTYYCIERFGLTKLCKPPNAEAGGQKVAAEERANPSGQPLSSCSGVLRTFGADTGFFSVLEESLRFLNKLS